MSVNTRQVRGRRTVRYDSYDQLLADAERLAQGPARALGNWSQGQIYQHLAMSLDTAIDGTGFLLPAPVRVVFTWLKKQRFLTRGVPAGFRAPARFVPADVSPAEGLAALRAAVARQQSESRRASHPAFGRMSRAEWDAFNLRHAELHMSFLQEVA